MFEIQNMRLKRKEETNIVGSGRYMGACPPSAPGHHGSPQIAHRRWLPPSQHLQFVHGRGVFNCQSSKWLLAGVCAAQRTLSASQERF